MLFCPKCGSMLVIKKDGNKKIRACSCGYTDTDIENAKIREEIVSKESKIEVVEKEEEVLPLVEAECPKCRYRKARYWLVQTRGSDEPETKFMKCDKCKHVWREYT